MAGFQFDEQLVPGLANIDDFLLAESSTGLPIYRRFNPSRHLEKRFLFIDSGTLPQLAILKDIMKQFALRYAMLERFSLETMNAAIANQYSNSVFVAGRINWPRFSNTIVTSGFTSTALLNDPYDEMAEKLIFIRLLAAKDNANAHPFTASKYESLLPKILEVDTSDERSMLRFLRGLSREERRVFRSPMTACFGALPDEDVQRRNVSIALDNLAQIDVVGVRARSHEFLQMIENKLGLAIFETVQFDSFSDAATVSSMLKNIGLVEDLLDEDIALYSYACEAVDAALGNGASGDMLSGKVE
jgi:hypothetical protein